MDQRRGDVETGPDVPGDQVTRRRMPAPRLGKVDDDGDEDEDADGEAQQGGSKRKRAAAQAPLSRKAALARQVAAFDEGEGNDSGDDKVAELDLSE